MCVCVSPPPSPVRLPPCFPPSCVVAGDTCYVIVDILSSTYNLRIIDHKTPNNYRAQDTKHTHTTPSARPTPPPPAVVRNACCRGGWWWLVVAGGGWWWLVVAGGGASTIACKAVCVQGRLRARPLLSLLLLKTRGD